MVTGMRDGALLVNGVRDYPGAEMALFATKGQAVAALRLRPIGPEVVPVRMATLFTRFWGLWAEPLGDPGEWMVLRTKQGGWLQVCPLGCLDVGYRRRTCLGHPMTVDESLAFTLALCGHRTRVVRIFPERRYQCSDGTYRWASAGTYYRAHCLCGWRGRLADYNGGAKREGDAHTVEKDPLFARVLGLV